MASHFKGPLVGSRQLFGGAGSDLDIVAAGGLTDLITVFDDFNGFVPLTDVTTTQSATTVNHWEENGWVLTAVGAPTACQITMNDAAQTVNPQSCIWLNAGTVASTGGNLQLDSAAALDQYDAGAAGVSDIDISYVRRNFEHLTFPRVTGGVGSFRKFILAFRLGFVTSSAGTFDGAIYVGINPTADPAIMTAATGVINTGAEVAGGYFGIHVNGNATAAEKTIYGVSQRTSGTAMATGTNRIVLETGIDATLGAATSFYYWMDFAIEVVPLVAGVATGSTTFYTRRIGRLSDATYNTNIDANAKWRRVGTLIGATPNNSVALVPTIEFINGDAAVLSDFALDWWAFGLGRTRR